MIIYVSQTGSHSLGLGILKIFNFGLYFDIQIIIIDNLDDYFIADSHEISVPVFLTK